MATEKRDVPQSTEELLKEAESAFAALEEFGYNTIDIPGLLLATRYRLQRLANRRILESRATDETEQERIWAEVIRDNPRLSGAMLVETLRYQIGCDYQTDPILQAHPLPDVGEPQYARIVSAFDRLGNILKELASRFPNGKPKEYLPSLLQQSYRD